MVTLKTLRNIRGAAGAAAAVTAFSASLAFAQDITLTFVGPESPTSMEPVIAAFEAANPTIRVNYESVPFKDLNSIIQARVGAGDADPDIYTADQPRIAALVDRGMLLGKLKKNANRL